MSSAFELLHRNVQRELYDMRWTELRPIQRDAILHLVVGGGGDCIISSPTASGKTEAAFLPIVSAIAGDPSESVRAIYVGPLKALINDQFRRVEALCARMKLPVHKWHGDVTDTDRKSLLNSPAGILLITPESLEAMFVLRPTQIASIFKRLSYVVIDELHSFLGTERGAQLKSLLYRLGLRIGADPLRIGLSATLGDPSRAQKWLRPDGRPVKLIEASGDGSEIGIRVRGIWRRPADPSNDDAADDPAVVEIARGILVACRGKTNLVFANSKSLIEELADSLTNEAKTLGIIDEVVVHHGSLSKEKREYAEARLRDERPCTAVCSNTLEMGIDIGEIDTVVQVSAPWSVSSLVQRLGRSGRRAGSQRVLRGFFVEDAPDENAGVWDNLHLGFVQGVATIELMLERFLESAPTDRSHFSTLVQQLLSILAETGGTKAVELYRRIRESGAFGPLLREEFIGLLRSLGSSDLIQQMNDGTLVLGIKGQKFVEHYSFFAAFKSSSEFRVVHGTSEVGSLPETSIPMPGEHLILGGRRWLVQQIDGDRKQVFVVPSKGRKLPRFASARPDLDVRIHRKMRDLLLGNEALGYLDDTAKEILRHARIAAAQCDDLEPIAQSIEGGMRLFLWAGSRVHRTLWLLFKHAELEVGSEFDSRGVGIDVFAPRAKTRSLLTDFIARPNGTALAEYAEEKLYARVLEGEKYDRYLPSELWRAAYVRERLDIDAAVAVARRLCDAMDIDAPDFPEGITDVRIVRNSAEWARQIAELEDGSALPCRIVVVRNERVAHILRRELAAAGLHRLLIGTRFVSPVTVAREILRNAGIRFREGEERLRPLRLRRVLREIDSLRYFKHSDVTAVQGWYEVFAQALDDLEEGGFHAETLPEQSDLSGVSDLRSIWQAVDADAADSWTAPRILAEATEVLSDNPEAWPFDGPTLWPANSSSTAAEAELLRRIPRARLAVLLERPARRRHLERIGQLFGRAAYEALCAAEMLRSDANELDVLRSFLFEPPTVLASIDRERSRGIDASVALERHASADEELDATVDWVKRQILEQQTPLEQIAVLVPRDERLLTLIIERLQRVNCAGGSLPVVVPAGVPVSSTTTGARILAVVDALERFLPVDAVADLTCSLRLKDSDGHLSRGGAQDLIYSLGFAGGSSVRRQDALNWRVRLERAEERLSRIAATGTASHEEGSERDAERGNRILQDLRKLRPALAALTDVAQLVMDDQPLSAVSAAFCAFVDAHLLRPSDRGVLAAVQAELDTLAAEPCSAATVGVDAVAAIRSVLSQARLAGLRFGEPGVYVGTLRSAVGLRFSSVRVIGLREGAVPSLPKENPALPDSIRRALADYRLSTSSDAATKELHALDHVVRNTTSRLSLSSARVDVDGIEHEPASVFTDAAAALRRPDEKRQNWAVIPDLETIERTGFAPARADLGTYRQRNPLGDRNWHDRLARNLMDVPPSWIGDPIRDLNRMSHLLSDGSVTPMDGVFDSGALAPAMPGVTPGRQLSASGLRQLLECPHRFLLERVLGFYGPSVPPSLGRIDALSYGTLFHRIAQRFYETHGKDFGDRVGNLDEWLTRADETARAAYLEFLEEYPLMGDAVRAAELLRVRRDVRTLVEYDWDNGAPRVFVAVERSFDRVSIRTSGGELFIRGRIDRIDREGSATLIRDLKTGRARPRVRDEADPDHVRDLQLALYGLVAHAMANDWGLPQNVVAAYAYADSLAVEKERAFRADYDQLAHAAENWMAVCFGLLSSKAFPRTPRKEDCDYCDFRAVCGPDALSRATSVLENASGALAAFKSLKS